MNSRTPFHKILIANRGEIALRVIRSARANGYATVAVYSKADAHARHVTLADQAVCIGEALPAQSYLNISAIIEAARLSGADAVHPGYGFLAENEDFAQACREAGLVFIGPSPEAITAMGNKAGAKRLMIEAGVPCVPGYQGEDQDEVRLAAEAERVGFPIMIKAVAGGGGRGMRLVQCASEFVERLRSAQSEAKNAFGDATVILERAIIEPRHIEIQIFADRHGSAIHLGERDCSVQRRHQKVIEEAPSPAVSSALRERMGATAVAAVKAIRYEGAGTLEFLLDREGNFYFMEMNTRLQVEHPVTEAVTGLDLVELQLRVASGEPLPLRQEDVQFRGHAMEVRLCAEDPDKDFMPQSGTMSLWHPAGHLRVEHAMASGVEIPPFYDSMIAKFVSHGETRDEARRKLLRGLEASVALGVKTNQVFLGRCLVHPVFADGHATTAFIGQHLAELLRSDDVAERRMRVLAAALLVATSGDVSRRQASRLLTRTLTGSLRFEASGRKVEALLETLRPHCYHVTANDDQGDVEIVDVQGHEVRFVLDGLMEKASFQREGDHLRVNYRGRSFDVRDTTHAGAARQEGGPADGKLRSSMNGRVIAVAVCVGQRVAAGQPMVTLEAMKMEHVHTASAAGVVTAVSVGIGDQVPSNRILAEVALDDAVSAVVG